MIYVAIFVPLGAVALLAAAFIYYNEALKTESFSQIIEGAEREFCLVHLSDLHGKTFCGRLIKKVAALKPDLIVFTGDIIHRYDKKNIKNAVKTVEKLKDVAPFLYVSGNHEMRNKGYREFRPLLKEAGAVVLDNSTVNFFGVNFVGLNGASNKNATLGRITPQGKNKILLSHMPQYFYKYAEEGYPLILCGHAHGGQWRIPFTNIGLYAPGQGIFPKFVGGEYFCGESKMILSRGLGNSEFPFRLFNRPHIVKITVKPQ